MGTSLHPPQLITNSRTLYLVWIPADPAAVENASLIARCGAEQDREAWEAVRAILPGLPGTVTAASLGEASGYGVRGMRAAFALIPAGLLRNPPGERLHMETPLTNGSSLLSANHAA